MRTLISIFLILTVTLSFSQAKHFDVNVDLDISPEKITASLNSQSENLDQCRIQVIDSMKHLFKTVDFPKATAKQAMKKYTETSFPIQDLAPGDYICIIYTGKEELYKRPFFKDAIFAEPQPALRPKNQTP